MTTSGYEAVRRTAGLVERPDRALLGVTGADRTAWLQGLLTNDVAALAPGHGCYAAHLTPQGRMVADLRVLRTDASSLLDVPAAARDRLLERFDMFIITEDVRVTDLSQIVVRLGVHGPAAPDVLARSLAARGEPAATLEARLAALDEHESLRVGLAGPRDGALDFAAAGFGGLLVTATRDYGVPGFDLFADADELAALRAALAASGVLLVDAASEHVLRVEAGRPLFGVDMDEETIPLEAGIEDRAISFTKGCYVGQEVIVRVRDRGHGRVAKRLVGLSAEAEEHGARVAAGDTLVIAGREAGRLTSVAFSPALERTIALGYVHRDFAASGSRVEVRHGDARVALVVTPTPFVVPA